MRAIPYRAELRSQLYQRVVAFLVVSATAVALLAVTGRLDDLNGSLVTALWITAGVLLAAAG